MITQELSSSGVRRRHQEQSVVKQCGMMHAYIEFAHVVCLVALPEHHCVQWVQGDIFSLSSEVMSTYSINTMSVGRR